MSSKIFEENYKHYCDLISKVDFNSVKDTLGIEYRDDHLFIRFFNRNYRVSKNGIIDISGIKPDYMVCVILAKYILLCPEQPNNETEWVSFRDFKTTSHFTNVNYFKSDIEQAIVKHFSKKLDRISVACKKIGGLQYKSDMSYDLSVEFNALPRLSLLLLFNDSDEEFPADCKVLFQKHSEYYLDPESLAMTGAFLVKSLKEIDKN